MAYSTSATCQSSTLYHPSAGITGTHQSLKISGSQGISTVKENLASAVHNCHVGKLRQITCPLIAKKLWEKRIDSLRHGISSTDPRALKERIKEAISVYLQLCSKHHVERECEFAKSFSNDLQQKTLHEFRTKYFSSEEEISHELNLPFIPDLIDFFTNKTSLKDYTIDQFLTEEEDSIETRLTSQSDTVAMNRNEMLRFLISLKQNDRQVNGRGALNAYVVDFEELQTFMDTLMANPPDQTKRLQLLVRNDVHYTAVEIELSPEGNRCLILDAALDPRFLDIAALMQSYPFNKCYAAGYDTKAEAEKADQEETKAQAPKQIAKIQIDTLNCSVFSLNNLTNSSKMPDLFEIIESLPQNYDEEKNIHFIDWINFPSCMVQKAQSISFLTRHNAWLAPEFKASSSFKEYIDQNAVMREARGVMKPSNVLIERKFDHYVEKMQAGLEQIDRQALMKIVSASPVVQLQNDLETAKV